MNFFPEEFNSVYHLIANAVKSLGYKNGILNVISLGWDNWRVIFNGEIVGIYNVAQRTFID